MSTAIITHSHRKLGNICTNFFNAHFFGFGAGNGIVQIGYIGLMVLSMVNFHGAGVDVGLQRVGSVGEFGKFEGHFRVLLEARSEPVGEDTSHRRR